MVKDFSDKCPKCNSADIKFYDYLGIKSLINRFTVYHYMIAFLIVLHLVSAFFYGFGVNSLIPVLLAVVTTILLDLFVEYFKSKKNRMQNSIFFPQSALISGLF